jgi:16S rRNA processing protein RimM
LERFVSIARIVKTRGIRGEVSAELLTDFPERFASVGQVRILCSENQYWEDLEGYWFHQERVILKFRGRDLPDTVQELVGGEVQIPEDQRVSLPEGSYYDSDLIGCRVLEGEEPLGKVVRILKMGAEMSNLVISGEKGEELMVPLVQKMISRIDVQQKLIQVKLPPGLVELASQEGKQRKGGRKGGRKSNGA